MFLLCRRGVCLLITRIGVCDFTQPSVSDVFQVSCDSDYLLIHMIVILGFMTCTIVIAAL